MAWYAFHGYNNGHAIVASAFDGAELNALGMHGYPTQADAEAKPNSVNFLDSAIVNAAIDDYNNARDLSPTVANDPTNPAAAAAAAAAGATTAAKKAAQGATYGLSDIGKFFANAGSRELWTRIAEGVIGVMLIIVVVARVGEGTPVGKLAKKVPFI